MSEKGKRDKSERARDKVYTDGPDIDLSIFEDDEEEGFIDYICTKCGYIDSVPEFIVAECSYDLEPGEDTEFICPECNGTLVRKKKPAEE
jgi:predicted RNA-binding Zn-ribbon protein involved in translation (DUF1610 family)